MNNFTENQKSKAKLAKLEQNDKNRAKSVETANFIKYIMLKPFNQHKMFTKVVNSPLQ